MDLLEPWRNAPPARYTLESDSEEEFDPEDGSLAEGGSRTASSSRRPEPVVDLKLSSAATGLRVIVAIEEAGRSWAEGLDTKDMTEDGTLSVNEKKVASISVLKDEGTAMVFFAGYLAYEGMHAVAEAITSELKPASLTIIDSYSTASYLSQKANTASIRYLATSFSSSSQSLPLDPFEPPNLVQGLAAALASEATENAIPCQLLLFPSNLSDSTSSSLISHSTRRQPAPEQIYDYGGPPPNSGDSLSSSTNRQALAGLGEKLGWMDFGWKVPTASIDGSGSRARRKEDTSKAGFGWWKEERRLGEREIGEGGMYI